MSETLTLEQVLANKELKVAYELSVSSRLGELDINPKNILEHMLRNFPTMTEVEARARLDEIKQLL